MMNRLHAIILILALAIVMFVAGAAIARAKNPHPPASPWFMTEVQPLIAPLVDLAHTDNYGIDGDVVTWEQGDATWWTFVLVVLPDNQTPVAAVVTVRQLRGERLRLWHVSRPFHWTPDLSLISVQH